MSGEGSIFYSNYCHLVGCGFQLINYLFILICDCVTFGEYASVDVNAHVYTMKNRYRRRLCPEPCLLESGSE